MREKPKFCEQCKSIHGPAPKPYRSTYEGPCMRCQKIIYKGEFVGWSKKIKGGSSERHHANCASPRLWPYNELGCRVQPPSPNDAPMPEIKAPTPNPENKMMHNPFELKPDNEIKDDDDNEIKDEQFEMEIPEEDTPSRPAREEQPMISKPKTTGDTLLDTIAQKVQEHVVNDINEQVRQGIENIEKIAKEKIDQITVPSIEVKRVELPPVKIDNVHKLFGEALELLSAGANLYFHGGPGGMKTSMGPQLAEALGVRFFCITMSEQCPEYRLMGFTSPVTGDFISTPFLDFYENGGLYYFSELDLANDNFRASLNVPLDNGYVSTDKGMIKRHKQFYCIGDGNTAGNGCHPAFPSRTAFDAATQARFEFIDFEYDWNLCRHIATGLNKNIEPVVTWAEMVANFALAQGIQIVVSPREVYKLAKFLAATTLNIPRLFDIVVFKGIDMASKEKILTNYPIPSITR